MCWYQNELMWQIQQVLPTSYFPYPLVTLNLLSPFHSHLSTIPIYSTPKLCTPPHPIHTSNYPNLTLNSMLKTPPTHSLPIPTSYFYLFPYHLTFHTLGPYHVNTSAVPNTPWHPVSTSVISHEVWNSEGASAIARVWWYPVGVSVTSNTCR